MLWDLGNERSLGSVDHAYPVICSFSHHMLRSHAVKTKRADTRDQAFSLKILYSAPNLAPDPLSPVPRSLFGLIGNDVTFRWNTLSSFKPCHDFRSGNNIASK